MGKTKTAFIGETAIKEVSGKDKYEKKLKERESKGVRVPGLKGGQRVVSITADLPEEKEVKTESTKEGTKPKKVKHRGKRYLASLAKIDPTRQYNLQEAINLALETSVSRFDGKVELHMVLNKGGRFEVALPHSDSLGKKKIEIANEETIEKLKKGVIDFDILLSTPGFMPKLVPFARLLGPKGLMPNPKSGTITDNPQKAIERFSDGNVTLQTEKNAPVLHTVVGKLSDDPKKLIENTQAIILGVGRQNIKKAVLSPSMGPGIKLVVN